MTALVPVAWIFHCEAGVAECRYISLPVDPPFINKFTIVLVAPAANSTRVFGVFMKKLLVVEAAAEKVVVAELFLISRL